MLTGLIVCAALGGLYGWWRSRDSAGQTPADPRLASSVSHRNIHPGVEYVAEETCARCHAEIAARFRQHPMGQSLAPVAKASRIERFDEAAHLPFTAAGFRYEVLRDGQRVTHKESRLNAANEPVAEVAAEVQFAIGSGRRGRSYLIDRDSRLLMSPLTWYPEKGLWDLSPGYEVNNSHFSRPVLSKCLFCHSQRALELPDTLNRYQPPIFAEHAIGCQRCHGPGQLHVARHDQGLAASAPNAQLRPASGDDTIVNPGRLSPELREAVCEQCHLGGIVRVPRRGRATYDYRPGLPLAPFLSVFVKAAPSRGEHKFVGHVEQMHASRCFQASQGRLGCTSCHDPHGLPAADEKAAYYDRRCQVCHQDRGCSMPETERRQTSPANHCVGCHMPRLQTEISHTAITDHGIPRSPEARNALPAKNAADFPLAFFHHDSALADDPEAQRDMGIATVMTADFKPELIERAHLARAHGWLAAAVVRDPNDIPALEALGHVQWSLGSHQPALDTFDRVLALVPDREFALDGAASRAQSLGKHELAIGYWRRIVKVNPSQLRYHLGLAISCAETRQWADCAAACQAALDLHPAHPRARQLLVESFLGLGQFDRAQTEFDKLLKFDPPQPDALRQWFLEHPLRRSKG